MKAIYTVTMLVFFSLLGCDTPFQAKATRSPNPDVMKKGAATKLSPEQEAMQQSQQEKAQQEETSPGPIALPFTLSDSKIEQPPKEVEQDSNLPTPTAHQNIASDSKTIDSDDDKQVKLPASKLMLADESKKPCLEEVPSKVYYDQKRDVAVYCKRGQWRAIPKELISNIQVTIGSHNKDLSQIPLTLPSETTSTPIEVDSNGKVVKKAHSTASPIDLIPAPLNTYETTESQDDIPKSSVVMQNIPDSKKGTFYCRPSNKDKSNYHCSRIHTAH